MISKDYIDFHYQSSIFLNIKHFVLISDYDAYVYVLDLLYSCYNIHYLIT